MSSDLFGKEGKVPSYKKLPVVQPYQKPRAPQIKAWTHCEHTPPCHAAIWCSSGARDIRDLQKKYDCSIDEAMRRYKTGDRA